MKKKVKKIPKYSLGSDMVSSLKGGEISASSKKLQGIGDIANQTAIGGQMIGSALGIELGLNAQIANGIASMLEGVPVIGDMLAAPVRLWGGLAGGGGWVDETTGEMKKSSGLTRWLGFGRDDNALARKSNMIKNSIISKTQTQNLQADYYSNPNVTLQPTTAAEGGIMRLPVDALVSKGELIYDPVLKKLTKVPGNKGEANTDDDVFAKLQKGWIVIPNSNNSKKLTTNDKTVAYNLEPMVDKPNIKMSKGTIEARDRIIKKASRLNELIKDKPQEYVKFKDGWNGEIKTWDDYLKYQYNLSKGNKIDSLDNFWGYDSKNKKYTSRWDKIIEYIGENKELREKAIKDLSGLGYVGTGKDAWDNIVKAAYDTKPADVHRYFKSVGDVLLINEDALKPVAGISNVISVPKGISQKNVRSLVGGVDITNSYVPQQESEKLIAPPLKKVSGLMDTYDKDVDDTYRSLRNRKRLPKLRQLGESISDFAPLAALFGDYDYRTESSQITPPRFVPVNADPRPLLRAADESSSIGNYNLANMGVGTGAYLAHSALLASDRAKRYADAHKWQQETNNKLIAQNAGIYNDWRKQRDAYVTQAIADTRANEGAAQQMRDSAIRDAYEFVAGRRNDKMRLAMMEPLAKYAFDDDTYKKIYSRAIV